MSNTNNSDGARPPNDGENPLSNDGQNGDSGAVDSSGRPTTNITVSIQYSYFTPTSLTGTTAGGNSGDSVASGSNSGTSNIGDGGSETTAAGIPPMFPVGRPDGSLVLSFRDVPSSTPQQRLESIISIAAELAMRRFSDMVMPNKGIPREEFDKLKVLKLKDLPADADKTCGVCYDEFVDEPVPGAKRERETDNKEDEEEEGSGNVKRAKVSSENEGPQPNEGETRQTENGPNQGTTSTQNSNTLPNQEESNEPVYLESPVELPCHHIFGRECLYKWTRHENTCPLCRHIIVELTPEQRNAQQESNNNNTEAFERIRQLLYSANPEEVVNPLAGNNTSENNNNNNNNNDNNDITTGNGNSAQTASTTDSGTQETTVGDGITYSRREIVFLRPDYANGNATPVNVEPASTTTASAPQQGSTTAATTIPTTTSTSGSNSNTDSVPAQPTFSLSSTSTANSVEGTETPSTTSTQPSNRPTDSSFRWYAVPVTVIQLGNGNLPTGTQTQASPESANGTPASSNINLQDMFGQQNPTPLSRSNSFWDEIFSVAPPLNFRRPFSERSQNQAGAPPVPPGILASLASRLRGLRNQNPATNNVSEASNTQPPQPESLFNTGVASIRGSNGEVSTFNIHNEELPSVPQHHQPNNNDNEDNEQNTTEHTNPVSENDNQS
ncbi:hypothetical protein Kpol_1036p66 [Vanderwaltozyma polyspora DSM 70294]|uniref:RING-type domain-containing protein n=1 Tax=Vanderwaltozyma polyspora (strain ATCC 22028 / DSM 70294 / BCRC 21397 / CBS 2163 / NBRC 10782 / NRRL Y-8283 / UCD 57-17) TaxID=436907 RepID=A7TEL4_VANPO|nr:uncharacterized protein Kpol_1036p66 [Vanderwaltozyma polyspora DSM 70294]EDO19321.1 hypothetical protein Kpol_1036p66 [Vanderwaltozyma polyspora DSM 70294]